MDQNIVNAFWSYEDEEISNDGTGDMATHYYEFWNEVFKQLDTRAFNAALKRCAKDWPEGRAADFLNSAQYRQATQPIEKPQPIEEPRNHFESDGKSGYWGIGPSGRPFFWRD